MSAIETPTISPRFFPDTEASKSGAWKLTGTPLVGQRRRSAKGVANDDERDSEDGEPRDPVDDPAVHGDTARERHGKEDHGDGGDNKKTAVEDPATAKDQGARHETKEALIVQTNDGHGFDAGKEETLVAVTQEGVSLEAPKSAAGARSNTRTVTRAGTAAAAKPRQNAVKGSQATVMKAVVPGRRAAMPSGSGRSQARQRVRHHSKAYDMRGDEDCVGGNEVDVVDKPYIRVKVRFGGASSGQDQLRCRGRRQR
ncbi:hypothetical protein MTO96_028746 [Rhipicephalus appendiculatus]